MSDTKVQLYFDKDNKIRAFDPAKFERSDQLEKECGSFVSNISTFNEKVHSLVEVLEAHASRIDSQKLKVRTKRLSPVFSSRLMKYCHFVAGDWSSNGRRKRSRQSTPSRACSSGYDQREEIRTR